MVKSSSNLVKAEKQNKNKQSGETMKAKIIIAGLALVLIASMSFAQIFPYGGGAWSRLYDDLKLTDEQKTKLQNLFFEFRKNQVDIAGKLSKARIELQQLLSAEKPDKSAIDKKIDEISGYMKEMTKNRVNHWMNVQQILTPEQRKILNERFGLWGFGRGFRDGFRGGMKPGKRFRMNPPCW